MEFVLATIGMVGFIVLALVMLGRAYPGSGADLVDWKPTQSYEVQAQLEVDDIDQMIEAQNRYRRKRGAKEITHSDAERMAHQDNVVRQRGQMRRAAPKVEGQIDELDGVSPERIREIEDELDRE